MGSNEEGSENDSDDSMSFLVVPKKRSRSHSNTPSSLTLHNLDKEAAAREENIGNAPVLERKASTGVSVKGEDAALKGSRGSVRCMQEQQSADAAATSLVRGFSACADEVKMCIDEVVSGGNVHESACEPGRGMRSRNSVEIVAGSSGHTSRRGGTPGQGHEDGEADAGSRRSSHGSGNQMGPEGHSKTVLKSTSPLADPQVCVSFPIH